MTTQDNIVEDTGHILLLRVMHDISAVYPAGNITLAQTQKNITDVLDEIGQVDTGEHYMSTLNNFLLTHRADKLTCIATWALYHDYKKNFLLD